MQLRYSLICLTCTIALVCQANAQMYDTNYNYVVETFSGSGYPGYMDGQGTQAMFRGPRGGVCDSANNLFVWDSGNNRIRKITPSGMVSTFAGGGTNSLPGYGTNALLPSIPFCSTAMDHSNTMWIANVASGGPSFLLRVQSDGYVSSNYFGSFGSIGGICVDSGNNVLLSADDAIYRYRINGGLEQITNFVLFHPGALITDSSDNIYVSGLNSSTNGSTTAITIGKIDQNTNFVTLCGGNPYLNADGVGTNASFYIGELQGMCSDESGNIILACTKCIRKLNVSTRTVTTIAGSFVSTGYVNGTNYLARFGWAWSVCMLPGHILVVDGNNQCIRDIYLNPAGSNILSATISAVVSINGVVGRKYSILSSSDLINWNPEATIILTSSPFAWIDPKALGQRKYYQALLLP
jgi:hypothetical protein